MLFRSDRKSTRLNSSHTIISYAVFCLKKKNRRAVAPPAEGVTSLGGSSPQPPPVGSVDELSAGRPAPSVLRGCVGSSFVFFFNDTATTEIYTLSLHDALPI